MFLYRLIRAYVFQMLSRSKMDAKIEAVSKMGAYVFQMLSLSNRAKTLEGDSP